MKIQCDVCGRAKAEVLCCADEAVLCKACDAMVHTANKLSRKHERVSLLDHPPSCSSSSSSSPGSLSQLPFCDKCKVQERKAYVFCLEERAMLCRHCDISNHARSTYVLSHQRFLIAGIKVDLQSSTDNNADIVGCSRNQPSRLPLPMGGSSVNFLPDSKENMATMTRDHHLEAAASTETTATFPGEPCFSNEDHWPLDETYDSPFNFYGFLEVDSSRFNICKSPHSSNMNSCFK